MGNTKFSGLTNDLRLLFKKVAKSLKFIANDKKSDSETNETGITVKSIHSYPLPKPRVVKVRRVKRKRRSVPIATQSIDPRFNHSLRRGMFFRPVEAPIPRQELGDGTVTSRMCKDERGRKVMLYYSGKKSIYLYPNPTETFEQFLNRELEACRVFGELAK